MKGRVARGQRSETGEREGGAAEVEGCGGNQKGSGVGIDPWFDSLFVSLEIHCDDVQMQNHKNCVTVDSL